MRKFSLVCVPCISSSIVCLFLSRSLHYTTRCTERTLTTFDPCTYTCSGICWTTRCDGMVKTGLRTSLVPSSLLRHPGSNRFEETVSLYNSFKGTVAQVWNGLDKEVKIKRSKNNFYVFLISLTFSISVEINTHNEWKMPLILPPLKNGSTFTKVTKTSL